jgi:hypothetical protein
MKRELILFSAAVLSVSAQIPESQITWGQKNGRFWAAMPQTARVHYLFGFAEALSGGPGYTDFFSPSETFGETVKGIDQFYEDPANAAITITALPRWRCLS